MTALDLLSATFREDPYPTLAALRSQPVALGPQGLWAVAAYEDVRAVLSDAERFGPWGRSAREGSGADELGAQETSLLVDDPALRGERSALVRQAFTAPLLEVYEREVRQAAHTLVDRILERDVPDVMGLVAVPLPAAAMADLLGVGPARRGAFMRWATEAISPGADVDLGERSRRLRTGLPGFRGYLGELLAQRRADPGLDLLSTLATSKLGERTLTDGQIVEVILHMLLAGNEAIADLIGNTVLCMVNDPEVLATVRGDPSRIPALVEETLRHSGPLLGCLRSTRQEISLGGATLPTGASVLALVAAANRDPQRFPDPDRFDLGRDTSGHLALGLPEAEMLWAPRARLEARVAIEVLFERLPDFARAEGSVGWCSAWLHRGPRSIPLCFTGEDHGVS